MVSFAVSCCFLDSNDNIYESFEKIGTSLEQQDVHLIIFGSWENVPEGKGFTAISLPFLLSEQAEIYNNFYATDVLPMSISAYGEFTALDKTWGATKDGTELHYLIQRAFAFWQTIFEILSPICCVAWGTTAPTSRAMLRIAQNRQIPSYIMERGFLDDTLLFGVSGQTSLNIANCSPEMIVPNGLSSADVGGWEQIKSYYDKAPTSRYVDKNNPAQSKLIETIISHTDPKVLYLGSNDRGTGIVFDSFALGEKYSPSFLTSESAYHHLLHSLETNNSDALLVCKPHPSDPFPLPESTNVRQLDASDTEVRDLVKHCDIVVGLSSGTHFLSLIYEKPLVTMANSFLMGQGASYEAIHADKLVPAITAAISKTGFDEQLLRGKYLTRKLYDNFLFGTNKSVPAKLDVEDVSKIILRFKNYTPRKDKTFIKNIDDLYRFLNGSSDAQSWNRREDHLNRAIEQLNQELEFERSKNLEIASLKTELESAHQALSNERNTRLQQDAARHALTVQVADLELTLDAKASHISDLNIQAEALTTERNTFANLVDALNQELDQERTRVQEALQQQAESHDFSRALEIEIKELNKMISEKEALIAAARAQTNEASDEIRRLHQMSLFDTIKWHMSGRQP